MNSLPPFASVTRSLGLTVEWVRLPWTAKKAVIQDRAELAPDPGIDAAVDATAKWLALAQDRSASGDGGVARDYSLLRGWATSYPETTGYIVPTIIRYARRAGDDAYERRACRMLDWLVGIQLPEGAFQGGRIDSRPRTAVVFNTGQILIGLANGVREYGDRYLPAMTRAADWLVEVQDDDGCWREGASPFAMAGEKTYDTHVAWGLLEAYRTVPHHRYLRAALRQVHWALTKQHENGWMEDCCLTDPSQPLTHTLGYALRGIVEAYRESGDREFIAAAKRLADGLLSAMSADGWLPGCLRSDWSPAVSWVCLTGSAQIASCWFLLYELTTDAKYLHAAVKANSFVRRTISYEGPPGIRGGVKGSHPIDGEYGRFEYLSWAAKFLLDSLLTESELAQSPPAGTVA